VLKREIKALATKIFFLKGSGSMIVSGPGHHKVSERFI
jgi:hypothetical protein